MAPIGEVPVLSRRHALLVSLLLLFFGVWDFALAAGAAVFPEFWFRFFHDAPYIDPQALLRRTGAIWAAFGVFHLVALWAWKRQPWWLAIVAGMRLSEIFADLTYLCLAESVTTNGKVSLLLATPSNIFFSVFFLHAFLKMTGGLPGWAGGASRSGG